MPAAPSVPFGRRAAVAVAAVVLAGGGTLAVIALGSDDPPPPAPTTTTSTTTSTTTTVPAPDPGVAVIATAAVPELPIHLELPPDGAVATMEQPLVAKTVRDQWPPFTPERPGAPAIPNESEPVAGRHAVQGGWVFSNPTSFGDPATFLVTEQRGDWLRVVVPVRPHQTEGWVRASDVTVSTTTYRIQVSIGERKVRLWDRTKLVAEAPVVVGASTSPTPTGRFFVTDSITKSGGSYGTGILALSAYSQALDHFDDGVPVIALHGTNHPELMGQARSNGCVRMENATIDLLRATVPLGTPVDLVA
jgi:lipoprotein-anchoring transpeptidase ErfK/SrfK